MEAPKFHEDNLRHRERKERKTRKAHVGDSFSFSFSFPFFLSLYYFQLTNHKGFSTWTLKLNPLLRLVSWK